MHIEYDKEKQKTYTDVKVDKLEMIKWADKDKLEDAGVDFASDVEDDDIFF
jgi:hypothetical protein